MFRPLKPETRERLAKQYAEQRIADYRNRIKALRERAERAKRDGWEDEIWSELADESEQRLAALLRD